VQDPIVHSDDSSASLVISWVLMIPLFYFASLGVLWFQSVESNHSGLGPFSSAFRTSTAGLESRAIVALVFLVVAVAVFSRMKAVIGLCRTGGVFVALVTLALASCAWSQYPATSLQAALYLALDTLFAFYLYRRFSHKQLLELFMMIGWICLIMGFTLALFFPQYGISNYEGEGAWRGISAQKNTCSLITTFLLPAAFCSPAATALSKISRVIYIVLSAFMILMTQSGTGKTVLACLLLYAIVMRNHNGLSRGYKRIKLLAGVAAGAALLFVYMSYFSEITYMLGKDPTLTGRTEIWKSVIPSVLKRPLLGYGYQAFWGGLQGESLNVWLVNRWAVSSVHNGYLEMWLGLGVVGLGLVIYSLVRALRNAFICLTAGESPSYTWYVSIVLLTIILSVDESGTIACVNELPWIMYTIACVGLSDGAKRIRLGLDHE